MGILVSKDGPCSQSVEDVQVHTYPITHADLPQPSRPPPLRPTRGGTTIDVPMPLNPLHNPPTEHASNTHRMVNSLLTTESVTTVEYSRLKQLSLRALKNSRANAATYTTVQGVQQIGGLIDSIVLSDAQQQCSFATFSSNDEEGSVSDRLGSSNRVPLNSLTVPELGGSQSRRRSRETVVTWDCAIYPECAVESIDIGNELEQPANMDGDCAPCCTPEPPSSSRPKETVGFCLDDDVVFPIHNVLLPLTSPAKGPQTPSLQDKDIALDVEPTSGGTWSEAELEPIIASPRRERLTVPVHANTLLSLSASEMPLVLPGLSTPLAGCDGGAFMLPCSASCDGSTNRSLGDDSDTSGAPRLAKAVTLRSVLLESNSTKPLQRRRPTGAVLR